MKDEWRGRTVSESGKRVAQCCLRPLRKKEREPFKTFFFFWETKSKIQRSYKRKPTREQKKQDSLMARQHAEKAEK